MKNLISLSNHKILKIKKFQLKYLNRLKDLPETETKTSF